VRDTRAMSASLRRSVRRPTSVPSERRVVRAPSPAPTELSLPMQTPSVSPTPVDTARQYQTPGRRSDGTPKRPMNAFILFSNEKRSELADRNPTLSNAAVSVLLGQAWRDMSSSDKSGYVSAARKIKEQFHAENPDAKTRCISRKAKRKHDGSGPPRAGAQRMAIGCEPASLHALALVGSRLNQNAPHAPTDSPFQRSSAASTYSFSRPSFDEDDEPNSDDGNDAYDEFDERTSEGTVRDTGGDDGGVGGASGGHGWNGGGGGSLSLLEQLCTVAESEHTAAARALSAFGGC